MKYRVKLNDKRVVGPFEVEEIVKLYRQEKIDEMSNIQEFPDGSWERILDNKNLYESIVALEDNVNNDDTLMMHLNDIKGFKKESEGEKLPPSIEKKQIKDQKNDNNLDSKKDDISNEEKKPIIKNENELDETKVINDESELDKTKINPDYQEYLKQLKKEKEELLRKEKQKNDEIELELAKTKVDLENDATQVVSLGELRGDLLSAIESEKELEDEVKEKENFDKELRKKKKQRQKEEFDSDLDEDSIKDDKKKKILFVAAFLFIIFFLFDDEEDINKEEKNKTLTPVIVFPDRYDPPDKLKASNLYKKGLLAAREETLASKIKASKLFAESLSYNYNDNPAANKLIFYYSDLLKDSKVKIQDANIVFKLVQIFNNKMYLDPHYASAILYFYFNIERYSAALRIFDKYITLNRKVASETLFAVRLLSLIEAGKLDLASQMAKQLNSIDNKKFITLKALIKFYKLEQKNQRLNALILKGQELFPKSAFFLIEKGYQQVKVSDVEGLKKTLLKLKKMGYERSLNYKSDYLTLMGFYFVYKNNNKKAAESFKKALDLKKSDYLIEKLALLELTDNENVDDLIKRSRSEKYVKLARQAIRENDFTKAFKLAFKGTIEAPKQIQPKLLLAELQIKQGFIGNAIKSLESIYNDNTIDNRYKTDVLYTLIEAYVNAFKFKKAQEYLRIAFNKINENAYKYFKTEAKYYFKKKEYVFAASKISNAIRYNPLDDENFYFLARLYLKLNRFNKAKLNLNKAIDLDPSKVVYRIDYAKILYEVENYEAAISYLFNVLEDFPDHPKILSEIGIYYYRSGQIAKYNSIKKTLINLPKKDESLYEFLIESSRLDDDLGGVIDYSEKLVEIAPGRLDVRMDLATTYIERESYAKAKVHLEEIKSRLDSYPKLNYLYARLNLLLGREDEAKKMALEEIEENPLVKDGYLVLGDIFIRQNEFIKAREQYVKALQRDSKSVDAILGIAFVALKTNQYDLAINQYQKALELDKNNPKVYKLLGDAYRKIGQSQLAIPVYKQYLELSPNSKYKRKIMTYIETMQ